MKLLHTSDIHFGISVCEQPLAGCQREFVDCLICAVKENDADGVIIAGDVFDRALVNAKALSLYDEMIIRLHELKKPVFVIAGNHDAPERLALLGGLLSKNEIYISGRLTEEIKPVSFGNADIYLIPYFNLDTARAVFPDESFESYDDAFKYVTGKILEKADKSKFNIAVSHCYVKGGTLSESDRSARLGQAMAVEANAFSGFDYAALGHLHAPHFVSQNVRYSGTPFPYSFGEKGGRKSFTLIDTENGGVSEIFPTYSKTLRTVEGTYLEVLREAERDENKQDFIKIVLTDKYPSAEIFNALREAYPNLLSFEGMARMDAQTTSALRAEKLEEMSPVEILESYFSGREELVGDFEKEWFEKALAAVTGEADKQ